MSSREKEVAERLEKDRETTKDRFTSHPMSRTNSRTASLRTRSPPPASGISSPPTPNSPKLPSPVVSANVRPAVSFASAASAKREALAAAAKAEGDRQDQGNDPIEKVAEQLNEVNI